MISLKFELNKNYLITHTIANNSENRFSSNKNRKDIINFQNYAWKLSKNWFNFLAGRFSYSPNTITNSFLESIGRKLPKYLDALKASKEFKIIYYQTCNYKNFCKKQWAKNYKKTYNTISGLTQLSLNADFKVFITHSSLKNGRYIENNQIVWGHNEDWNNYATVYLWHEILHSFLGNSDVSHTLIQLITDNELRIRLNRGKYPPFEGHPRLFNSMSKILPLWKNYLSLDKKDFNSFKKEVEAQLGYGT